MMQRINILAAMGVLSKKDINRIKQEKRKGYALSILILMFGSLLNLVHLAINDNRNWLLFIISKCS